MGLLRLATYAIVGYAAYAIITDIMNAPSRPPRQRPRRAPEPGAAPQLTGPAREQGGRVEETQNPDGGSTPHRVGRGVIPT
jgi:hypothetical protein